MMVRILRYSTPKLLLVFLSVCCICIVYYQLKYSKENQLRHNRVESMEEAIKEKDNKYSCKQPVLPVDSPEMMKFVKKSPKITCGENDWVTCKESECVIKSPRDGVVCKFRDILRDDDHTVRDSPKSIIIDRYTLVNSDVVKIQCVSGEDEWVSIKTGIRADPSILEKTGWEYLPENSLKMNVLMFGLDSVSKNTFIRKLPKTYKYLVEELSAHVLQGYNIVGDGTPQALTPILTGQTELELPDVRKRFSNTDYVDVYPFIWKEYKKKGYITAFFEDLPFTGTYTYRLNGFNKQPTDHYMRSYYLASNGYHSKWKKLCDGETPRHKLMLDKITEFYTVYKDKPKFLFGFHGELSHDDYNLVGAADDDLLEFLTNLNENNILNNTILIIMADHGHRFADIRNTLQGKLEERMPFFSFRFPPWFKNAHQEIYENFLSNVNILTTPFDIHATLEDILERKTYKSEDLRNRSLSLFSNIPKSRTCSDAYIEPHWCACLDWYSLDINDKVVPYLIEAFLNTLNNFTHAHRDICAKLNVSKIMAVTKLKPQDKLLKFKQTSDKDGFVPNLSGSTQILTEMYQIKVQTTPGEGIFEASITHSLTTNNFNVKLSDVSRINMYGRQARCVENTYPNLRKYCYCTSD